MPLLLPDSWIAPGFSSTRFLLPAIEAPVKLFRLPGTPLQNVFRVPGIFREPRQAPAKAPAEAISVKNKREAALKDYQNAKPSARFVIGQILRRTDNMGDEEDFENFAGRVASASKQFLKKNGVLFDDVVSLATKLLQYQVTTNDLRIETPPKRPPTPSGRERLISVTELRARRAREQAEEEAVAEATTAALAPAPPKPKRVTKPKPVSNSASLTLREKKFRERMEALRQQIDSPPKERPFLKGALMVYDARQALGISRTEAAKRLDISKDMLNIIEAGKACVPTDRINDFGDILKVDPKNLTDAYEIVRERKSGRDVTRPYAKLGAKLEACQAARGLSFEETATALGMSPQSYAEIRGGV
ncbi:MAG: helix-turn-helix transcriptional regulator, partial [Deltaproteobacteria bacterium]|nr:helix-turn-helix transcriptional regulator [Deltaproteobacteria bacterium]